MLPPLLLPLVGPLAAVAGAAVAATATVFSATHRRERKPSVRFAITKGSKGSEVFGNGSGITCNIASTTAAGGQY